MTTSANAKTRFRFVGSHLDDLADGRILEPGLFYNLTAVEAADPHNVARIEAGVLVEIPAAAAPTKKTKASAPAEVVPTDPPSEPSQPVSDAGATVKESD